jgi:hypothetical protein
MFYFAVIPKGSADFAVYLKKKKRLVYVMFSVFHILDSNDKSATIRKAMPVQNRSPVKKYTMAATMIAGIRIRNSFTSTIIIKPIMTSMMRKGMFNDPNPKLLRIE